MARSQAPVKKIKKAMKKKTMAKKGKKALKKNAKVPMMTKDKY